MKAIVFVIAWSMGCAATVGTGGGVYVPKDAAASCASSCQEIGLGLDSVVIMANNVGCVCSAAPRTAENGAQAGGGMAALLMRQQQQHQRQQNSSNRATTSTHH
jgi:hypothetical protein